MTLSHQTDVYESPKAQSDRKRPEYSFVLVLVCMALALVVANAIVSESPVNQEVCVTGIQLRRTAELRERFLAPLREVISVRELKSGPDLMRRFCHAVLPHRDGIAPELIALVAQPTRNNEHRSQDAE